MRIVLFVIAGLLLFAAGFAGGYVYNENFVCRVALGAAKAAIGGGRAVIDEGKTALEAACAQDPTLKRCLLLNGRGQGQ